jgi:hypothetical protein
MVDIDVTRQVKIVAFKTINSRTLIYYLYLHSHYILQSRDLRLAELRIVQP